MGKGLKLKKRFAMRRGSLGGGSEKKDRSKAAARFDDESEEFVYSQDANSDSSNHNEDEFFHRTSITRFGLERTWSVNALQISTHSADNVYVESDSDENDSDGSSSYESFGSEDSDSDGLYTDEDDDDEAEMAAVKTPKTSKKKGTFTSPKSQSPRRSPMDKYKKQAKKRDTFAPEVIPEGDEEDEFEDISENGSDDNSTLGYATPATMTKSAGVNQLDSDNPGNVESGYSSDSASVRKRMMMMQQQQKQQEAEQKNEGKKKKGGKKKQTTKKKEKKKGNKNRGKTEPAQSGGGSLEGDSTVTTLSVESEDEGRQSSEKVGKSGKKKKKKKKKKDGKDNKDGKKKKKRVISFVVDGDEEGIADFDKRLDEIEQFEAALVEERKLIQKERETMAFERESMEMRLDEETHHCEELNDRIRELEQLLRSQKLSDAGDDAESNDEKQSLKLDFARERREFHLQLVEKEREIEKLKLAVRDLENSNQNGEGSSFDSNIGDGKSRERLQGELLQANAKVSEKEAQLKSQGIELESAREQIASLKSSGGGSSELKRLLNASQEDRRRLQQELEFERNENATKLKDKDETVSYLMTELARLKQTKGRR